MFRMKKIISLYRTLFAKRFFYKWNRCLLRCAYSGLGIDNFSNTEYSEKRCLQEVIGNKEKPILLDIGANVGMWSKLALQVNPNAKIFSFEPQRKSFAKLKEITGISAYNVGCGSTHTKLTLYDRADTPLQTHSSFCKGVIDHLNKGMIQEKCDIITMDWFIQEHKLPKIDLMKIDVEGFELEVLKGAINSLKKGLISAIQFEFNAMNVFQRVFFKDFYDLLSGFYLYRLLPKGKIPLRHYDPALHELFTYQNILAIAKN